MLDLVKIITNEYVKQGFNKKQAKSIAWAEHFEEKMAYIEFKYQGRVDGTIRIDCYCKDCNEGGEFLPYTTINFIKKHKNHNTMTVKIR